MLDEDEVLLRNAGAVGCALCSGKNNLRGTTLPVCFTVSQEKAFFFQQCSIHIVIHIVNAKHSKTDGR